MENNKNNGQAQNDTSQSFKKYDNIDDYFRNMIESFPAACRELGRKHLKCIFEKSKDLKLKSKSESEFIKNYENEVIPFCNKEFNIEECILKNKIQEKEVAEGNMNKNIKNSELNSGTSQSP